MLKNFHALVSHFHQEQAEGGPENFPDTGDDGDRHAHLNCHTQVRHHHGETALTSAQLQRNEKQQVGKERSESQNNERLHEKHHPRLLVGKEHEHEENLERLENASDVFQKERDEEILLILLVEVGNLSIDFLEVVGIFFRKLLSPFPASRNS